MGRKGGREKEKKGEAQEWQPLEISGFQKDDTANLRGPTEKKFMNLISLQPQDLFETITGQTFLEVRETVNEAHKWLICQDKETG